MPPAVECPPALTSLPGWALAADGKSISRRFRFADFEATMTYVNRLAAVANRHDHHPDLKVGYNYCEVLFTTHDVGGMTELDATCARAAQRLADAPGAPGLAAGSSGRRTPSQRDCDGPGIPPAVRAAGRNCASARTRAGTAAGEPATRLLS
ncbi:MAG: 4a-hydroxytetrahydrobiopterin dehydratase [Proteobacteria bacterium]|nr:4a-hydroxytetrahydrobiopterin dehydratase [Pseudomonadota bacterium]